MFAVIPLVDPPSPLSRIRRSPSIQGINPGLRLKLAVSTNKSAPSYSFGGAGATGDGLAPPSPIWFGDFSGRSMVASTGPPEIKATILGRR